MAETAIDPRALAGTAGLESCAIELDDLRVALGGTNILRGVSAKLARGQVTAVVGPTGCGKTTLLRSLNRLHDCRSGFNLHGRVLLNGQDIYGRQTDVRELRRRMGMLFQRPNPFPQSIAENVSLGARVHGLWSRSEASSRTEHLLRDVGLWDAVRDRLSGTPFALSGGQQQLLCLARVLAVEPEVLLLDEPTSSLDPQSTSKIEELITSFKHRITVIFVTHNLRQAARCADTVLFLEQGAVVEQSPVRRFFEDPVDPRSSAYVKGWAV
jgi:phosphate transport system ATP-binding protein